MYQEHTAQTPYIFGLGCLDVNDIVNKSNSSSSVTTQLSNMSLVSVKWYICTIAVERITHFFFFLGLIAASGLLWKELNILQ